MLAITGDDALVATPLGGMRLADYLPTRAFEITVHAIDVARATSQPASAELLTACEPALALCVDFAGLQERLIALLAFTGREPLPAGFSLL